MKIAREPLAAMTNPDTLNDTSVGRAGLEPATQGL
jgi:hypothetical protein